MATDHVLESLPFCHDSGFSALGHFKDHVNRIFWRCCLSDSGLHSAPEPLILKMRRLLWKYAATCDLCRRPRGPRVQADGKPVYRERIDVSSDDGKPASLARSDRTRASPTAFKSNSEFSEINGAHSKPPVPQQHQQSGSCVWGWGKPRPCVLEPPPSGPAGLTRPVDQGLLPIYSSFDPFFTLSCKETTI